ncbi:MAG: hypothetical protein HY702_04430 [Gemmatimonadetes bacterium]|nr:hypothetical protein [Gemmatimonadota bacterium]
MIRAVSSRVLVCAIAISSLVMVRQAAAQEGAAQDTSQIAELRRQIEAITRELEQLRLGQEVVVQADTSVYGLGPAASKVYRARQGVSLAGYGEMLYENFSEDREDGSRSGKTDQLDFLRGVVYVGYKFNERFLFNSEIEFEHGATDQEGSVSLEFAYVDYILSPGLGFRAGLLLPPMGLINEQHEPPIFLGTSRPETELRIIPSTWRENGIGIFGQAAGFAYRAYLINGFDGVGGGSSGASGFSAAGLRGGRQKGSRAMAEDLAFVGRVEYVGPLGFLIGTSVYVGNSGQGRSAPTDPEDEIGARALIWEGHAQYKARGLDVRGLVAVADVDDVAELNAVKRLEGSASIGERLVGGYVQAGYDVLHRLRTGQQLIPYVRYERLNTQDEVPEGFEPNPANDRRIVSIGAAWKPIPNIALKADYQIHGNEADTGVDQFNVNVSYLF